MTSNNLSYRSFEYVGVNKKYILIVIGSLLPLVLGVLAGFRVFGIEEDYLNYLNFYENIDSALFESRIEPIYQIITFVAKELLGLGFAEFLVVTAILGLVLKFFVIAQCKNPTLGLFFYLLVIYSLQEMTQIRLAVAIGFAYFSIYLFSKRRAYSGTAMLLISVGLHYSCAILIPALAYYYMFSKNTIKRITLAIFSVLLYAFSDRVVYLFIDANPMLLLYSELSADINTFNARNLTLIVFSGLSLIYLNRMNKTGQLNTVIFIFLLSISLGTQSIPPVSHRVAELSFFSIILILASSKGALKYLLLITFLPFSLYYFLTGITHFQ